MRVFLSLSEWSSCNCFSLEQLGAAQRNRIETTFAFKMSRDGEEGGSTALLPYTEQHHLLSLSLSPSLPPSFSHLLSPSLHPFPSTLSAPATPTSSSLSQHGSPCIVFPESSKVDGSLLIRAGYCTLSGGMDELICACATRACVCACVVRVPRPACVSTHAAKYVIVCVAVFLMAGKEG